MYGELLTAFPAERFSELDENYEFFEEIRFKACVLVETLLFVETFPTIDNRYQHNRASSTRYFAAPRWRTPPHQSRSPSPTTEQGVPIQDVMVETNTSSLREFSPEKQLVPVQANKLKKFPREERVPRAEASAINPVC